MGNKKKHFADDGWAIWVDGDDTSTVYINDWLNPKGKSFVDVSVRIRGIKECRTLNIYVPFSVLREEIEDVSLKFDSHNTLQAIFSTACVIDFKKNDLTSEVAYNAKTIDVVHIACTDYELRPIADGTIIKLDLAAVIPFIDNDEAYFAIRMPHKSLDKIFKKEINFGGVLRRIRDLITSPMVEEDYGYSVRINETRALPPEISKMGGLYRQKIKKAVVTISVDDDYELNDNTCYRVRRLEERLYGEYAPAGFNIGDAITYQWQQSRDENYHGQYNFYFNVERDYISKLSMLIYMIFVLILGVSGDATWDLIQTLFGWG